MVTADPIFTVVLPIHRKPIYLPLSVASVLNQTDKDFELFIIEDGAPEETHACAIALARSDERIRVFKFPKGLRHGEAHRASALEEARGLIITHINDDSLWMPDHLATIRSHSAAIDFGHTLYTSIDVDDEINSGTAYIENLGIRESMLEKDFSVANMCSVFYTRAAYENLPEKWAPAPEDIWTDLFMWRKFLRQKLKFGAIHACTTLFFEYPKNFSDDKSRARIEDWFQKTKTVEGCSEVREEVARIHIKAARISEKLRCRLRIFGRKIMRY